MLSPNREEGLQRWSDSGRRVGLAPGEGSSAIAGLAWQAEPAPFGRGDCLVAYDADNALRLLAPPGVPLAPPEAVASLLRWRSARWAHGRLAGAPRSLSFEDALALAPSKRAWIIDRAREREYRDQSAGYPVTEDVDKAISLAAEMDEGFTRPEHPRGRPPLRLTRSASTFSAHLAPLDSQNVVKQVALLADSERRLDLLYARLDELELQVGHQTLHEAVTALLHARARSHSWRYTRILGLLPSRDPLTRQIGREIDRASNGEDLELVLSRLASEHPGVEQRLVIVLHTRSRSLRWQLTRPARRLLAKPVFQPARSFLRKRVQPQRVRAATGIRRVLRTNFE